MTLGAMAVLDKTSPAIRKLQGPHGGQEIVRFQFDRLGQQATCPSPQHFG
jgi:hypothetical protein